PHAASRRLATHQRWKRSHLAARSRSSTLAGPLRTTPARATQAGRGVLSPVPSSRGAHQPNAPEAGQVQHVESAMPALWPTRPPGHQGPMIARDNFQLYKAFIQYQAEVLLKDPETVKHFNRYLKHLLRWADDVAF